jgi:hypothetical protein
MLRKAREYIQEHNKLRAALAVAFHLLLFIGGYLSAMGRDVDRISDECNQFVIDNYFTPEMQSCLMGQGKQFQLPYQNNFTLQNIPAQQTPP